MLKSKTLKPFKHKIDKKGKKYNKMLYNISLYTMFFNIAFPPSMNILRPEA